MPDIGSFHPQVVHFVVALGLTGVLFRLASFSRRVLWAGPAASALLLMAAPAAVVAVFTGDRAHGRAERIPGVRPAVQEHEEAGEAARNLLLAVAALELAALVYRRNATLQRKLLMVSGVAGLAAGFFIFEAGEHGGELVYSYAGGVGVRSGDPEDVRRLLVAGLYHQADAMRKAGNGAEAARLTSELVRQLPAGDPAGTLLGAESAVRDLKEPKRALAALDALTPPADDSRLAIRIGLLRAEALAADGQRDSARAVLSALAASHPESRRVAEALEGLK